MLEAQYKMKLFFAVRPWENEPDNAEWENEVGYKCRIVRNEITGVLLGYVGIPKEHKFWGLGHEGHNDEVDDISYHVHGGLTYSDMGDDGYWYFGFDTNHGDDFAPKMVEYWFERGYKDLQMKYSDSMKYKTWEFVDNEIHWLGKRLWAYEQYSIGSEEEK
jgi:hypothetical protein